MYKSKITQRNKQRSLLFLAFFFFSVTGGPRERRNHHFLLQELFQTWRPRFCLHSHVDLYHWPVSFLQFFLLLIFLSYWSYQFAFDIGSFFFFFLVPLRFCGVITGSHEESVEIMRFLLNIWQILEPDSHIWFVGNNVFVTMSMIIALILKDSWSNYSVLISQPFFILDDIGSILEGGKVRTTKWYCPWTSLSCLSSFFFGDLFGALHKHKFVLKVPPPVLVFCGFS